MIKNNIASLDADYKFIIGESSNKRTNNIVIPDIQMIIKSQGSFLVVDPTCHILDSMNKELIENGYNIVLLNLRNDTESDSWNPLLLPYKYYKIGDIDKSIGLLVDISNNIFMQDNKDNDPFWDIASKDLLVGISLILFEEAVNINQINLKSVFQIASVGFERFLSTSFLKVYFELKKNNFDYAYSYIAGTLNAPNDTRNSILSVFYQKIRTYSMGEKFSSILCKDSIDMEELSKAKTAFFVQFEEEKFYPSLIVFTFITQLFQVLASERISFRDKKWPIFSFIWDDFLLAEKYPYLEQLLYICKNVNIRLVFTISSLSAFENRYGKYLIETLKSHVDTFVFQNIKENISREFLECFSKNKDDNYDITENELLLLTSKGIQIQSILHENTLKTIDMYHHCSINETDHHIEYFKIDEFVKMKKIIEPNNNNLINNIFDRNPEIDDLIRRIDRKIDELEKEEADEKEQ